MEGLGRLPAAKDLERGGVSVHGKGKGKAGDVTGGKGADPTMEALEKLGKAIERDETVTTLVPAGAGLAALPKRLVEKMLAGEYVDFAELPPAKGKARAVPQALEGQVLVVQAADLMQSSSVYLRQATTLACKRHVQAMYKLHVQLPAVLMMYIVYMKSECPP